MTQYINKDDLVTEIEKLIDEIYAGQPFDSLSKEQQVALWYVKSIMSSIYTLEVKEVDFDKEIGTHLKDCLDAKFPTTDIELIKKDVTYTAKKFFELGFNAARKGD